MAIEKTIILKVDETNAVKGLDNIDKGVEQIDKSTDELKDTTNSLTNRIDKMTGGLISGFKNAVGGVKKGVIAMKSLKVAIAATGVGLLVLAFGALVTFFTKSQKGMDKLSVAMAQFGATVDVIIDRVIAVGEVLSKIFSQSFSETVDGVAESFAGMGDEIARDIALAKELELATQKLRDVEISQIATQAQRRQDIAKLRNESKDQLLTLDERIAKLKQAQKLEQDNLNEQLTNQANRLTIAAREDARANSTAEDFKTLQEEKARLIDLQTESYSRQRTVISELESLQSQGRKQDGGVQDEEGRSRVEILQTEQETELELITTHQENIADVINENDERILANKLRVNGEKLRDEREFEKQQSALRHKALNDLIFIAGSETKIGKALLIAKQLLSAKELALEISRTITFSAQAAARSTVAVAEGTAQTAKIGFPQNIPLLIGYAAQAVGIFSAIRNATSKANASVSIPNAPSISTTGGGSTPQQAPDFNVVGTSGVNQLADVVGSQVQKPIKAFVVSNEVTTNQALDRSIESTAVVG